MTAATILTSSQRDFLRSARRGVLATIAMDGEPRLVPICFVLDDERPVLYSPLDEKPKHVSNPADLARVRDIGRDPRVSILVDRWDEDWTRLAWLRCQGTAALLDPGHDPAGERASAIEALRSTYPQYRSHDLAARPLIRIAIERVIGWGRLEPG